MVDHATKALAIAVGLWINVASSWLRPVPVLAEVAAAQNETQCLILMQASLDSIQGDVGRIQRGTCSNSKIC